MYRKNFDCVGFGTVFGFQVSTGGLGTYHPPDKGGTPVSQSISNVYIGGGGLRKLGVCLIFFSVCLFIFFPFLSMVL